MHRVSTFVESIRGKAVYAGGSSSVNIREAETTGSAVIGNVPAGSVIGTATGNMYPDLDNGQYDWLELTLSGGRTGYVRADVAGLTAPAKPAAPGTGEYSESAFDSEKSGLPKWATAAIAVCFLMVAVSIFFLIRKRNSRK